MNGRADGRVTIWRGNYRFGADDTFFPSVVTIARKYVDKKPEQRPPSVDFYEQLERLRASAPKDGHVLLDQLSHRWTHPQCPPALYVVTCVLCASEGTSLAGEGHDFVKELPCTKVGQARHSIAARIERYKTEPLGGVTIVDSSPALRLVVYGDGPTMLLEREVQQVAQRAGSRAELVAEVDGRRQPVGRETYVGVGVCEAVSAFAREREPAPG
jgi:hypothetical protein